MQVLAIHIFSSIFLTFFILQCIEGTSVTNFNKRKRKLSRKKYTGETFSTVNQDIQINISDLEFLDTKCRNFDEFCSILVKLREITVIQFLNGTFLGNMISSSYDIKKAIFAYYSNEEMVYDELLYLFLSILDLKNIFTIPMKKVISFLRNSKNVIESRYNVTDFTGEYEIYRKNYSLKVKIGYILPAINVAFALYNHRWEDNHHSVLFNFSETLQYFKSDLTMSIAHSKWFLHEILERLPNRIEIYRLLFKKLNDNQVIDYRQTVVEMYNFRYLFQYLALKEITWDSLELIGLSIDNFLSCIHNPFTQTCLKANPERMLQVIVPFFCILDNMDILNFLLESRKSELAEILSIFLNIVRKFNMLCIRWIYFGREDLKLLKNALLVDLRDIYFKCQFSTENLENYRVGISNLFFDVSKKLQSLRKDD